MKKENIRVQTILDITMMGSKLKKGSNSSTEVAYSDTYHDSYHDSYSDSYHDEYVDMNLNNHILCKNIMQR